MPLYPGVRFKAPSLPQRSGIVAIRSIGYLPRGSSLSINNICPNVEAISSRLWHNYVLESNWKIIYRITIRRVDDQTSLRPVLVDREKIRKNNIAPETRDRKYVRAFIIYSALMYETVTQAHAHARVITSCVHTTRGRRRPGQVTMDEPPQRVISRRKDLKALHRSSHVQRTTRRRTLGRVGNYRSNKREGTRALRDRKSLARFRSIRRKRSRALNRRRG